LAANEERIPIYLNRLEEWRGKEMIDFSELILSFHGYDSCILSLDDEIKEEVDTLLRTPLATIIFNLRDALSPDFERRDIQW